MSWPGAASACHSRSPHTWVEPGVRPLVDDEALDALVAVVVEQRLLVPAFDERRFAPRARRSGIHIVATIAALPPT